MTRVSPGRTIGLTGNIASGKSSVARRLGEHGALVIDADIVAHEQMQPGLPAWEAVVTAFGRGILAEDGTIARPKLRQIVFDDAAALRRLNAAVHPHVHAALLRRIGALRPDQVAVIEAVAIVEAGTAKELDQLWVVVSSAEQQIARLMQTRGLTRADAAWRVAGQPPVEPKLALADAVLRNDGTLAELYTAVDQAWAAALATWGMAERKERER